ncbi:hypothetical protein EON65_26510, partial [archaeon]
MCGQSQYLHFQLLLPFYVFSRGNVVNLPPVEAHDLTAPLLSPLFSSTFSFSKCHMEKGGGANDPDLQMIWEEDDFIKYARYDYGYGVWYNIWCLCVKCMVVWFVVYSSLTFNGVCMLFHFILTLSLPPPLLAFLRIWTHGYDVYT